MATTFASRFFSCSTNFLLAGESRAPDDDDQAPAQIDCVGLRYRRRERTKSRHGVGTLFGIIGLLRLRYEPLEPGLPCLFPLECCLGVTAARATPALAERVGVWSAQHPQQAVLDLLRQEHGVSWSVQTLRHVAAAKQ